MKKMRFREDDRVVINKKKSPLDGKIGRVEKVLEMSAHYIVQTEDDRKYYNVKDKYLEFYLEEEDIKNLIDISLDLKDEEMFKFFSSKIKK